MEYPFGCGLLSNCLPGNNISTKRQVRYVTKPITESCMHEHFVHELVVASVTSHCQRPNGYHLAILYMQCQRLKMRQ